MSEKFVTPRTALYQLELAVRTMNSQMSMLIDYKGPNDDPVAVEIAAQSIVKWTWEAQSASQALVDATQAYRYDQEDAGHELAGEQMVGGAHKELLDVLGRQPSNDEIIRFLWARYHKAFTSELIDEMLSK